MKWTIQPRQPALASLALAATLGFADLNRAAQAAEQPPFPDGLVAYWNANDTFDDLTGANDGTPMNGVSFTEGRIGRAFLLDGANDRIDVGPLPGLDNAEELTLMAWVRPDAPLAHPGILGQYGDRFLFYAGEGSFRALGTLTRPGNQAAMALAGIKPIPQGEWTHVAVVWRMSDRHMAIHKNGELDAETNLGWSEPLLAGSNGGAAIGTWSPEGDWTEYYHWPGALDEVAVFRRALTPGEILYFMENGLVPPESTLDVATDSAARPEGDSGATSFRFIITRSGDQGQQSSVAFEVLGAGDETPEGAEGPARAPASADDFSGGALPSGIVVFNPGDRVKEVEVEAAGDTRPEPFESFKLRLFNPHQATLGVAEAVAVIENDDSAVTVEPGGGIGAPPEFLALPEGQSGNVQFEFTVRRSPWSTRPFAVRYEVAGGGAAPADAEDFPGGPPGGALSFPASFNPLVNVVGGGPDFRSHFQTIRVAVSGDALVEGDEGFAVALFDAGPGAALAGPPALGVILNDDTQVGLAPVAAARPEGDTGPAQLTFRVSRLGFLGTSTAVGFAVAGSGANPADAADFAGGLPAGSVTFAPGESSLILAINVSGDSMAEEDEEFTVVLTSASGGATLGVAAAKGVILNDDTPPRFRLSLAALPAGAGTVAAHPAPDSEGLYANGTRVTLTAMPGPGQGFVGWDFPGAPATPTLALAMDADRAVAALFEPLPSLDIALYAGILVSGTVGSTYVIEAATDPGGAAGWVGVAQITLTLDKQLVVDESTPANAKRFYRVRRL